MALEAWYPLHKDTEDYSGNDNHLIGTPTFIQDGVLGQAVASGAGMLEAPLNDSLKRVFNSADMTLTFWVRNHPATQDWSDILAFHDDYNIVRRFERQAVNNFDTSDFWVNIGRNDTEYVGPLASVGNLIGYPEGTWYHVTIRRTPTVWEMFIDGVLYRTSAVDNPEPTGISNSFKIVASDVCESDVSDVRLFSHALSNREISEIAKAKFLHWSIDGPVVRDRSGFRHHGHVRNDNGEVTYYNDSMHGSVSPYLPNSVDPEAAFSYFSSDEDIYLPHSGTMMCWIKGVTEEQNTDNLYPLGWDQFCTVADNGDGGHRVGFRFNYYNDVEGALDSQFINNSSYTCVDGEWHHVAVSWDNSTSTAVVWMDGVELVRNESLNDIYYAGTARNFRVGCGWSGGYGGFTGLMDDVRCYGTALSTEDILSIYRSRARLTNKGELTVSEVLETGLTLDDGTYPTVRDGNWVRIYHHVVPVNATGEYFFEDEAEAKWANPHDPLADKYSLLGKMEQFRQEDGRFQFKLRYPASGAEGSWYQTSNPLTTSNSVEGYEAISVDWGTEGSWGGLNKSVSGKTLLDGQPGLTNWWYAVGSYQIHSTGIPGPQPGVVNDVELYVWLPDSPGRVDRQGRLVTSEVSSMGVTDGLIGYWKLDQTTRESTSNIANDVETNITWEEGALSVGDAKYIRTGVYGVNAIANAAGFTLLCMGKAKYDNSDLAASWGHGGVFGGLGYNWGILKSNTTEEWYGNIWFDTDDNGSIDASSITDKAPSTGDWDFLCLTVDSVSGQMIMYVNDWVSTAKDFNPDLTMICQGDQISIGPNDSSNWQTRSLLKECRFYDRPLTPAEVESMRKLLSGNEKMQVQRDGAVYVSEVIEG